MALPAEVYKLIAAEADATHALRLTSKAHCERNDTFTTGLTVSKTSMAPPDLRRRFPAAMHLILNIHAAPKLAAMLLSSPTCAELMPRGLRELALLNAPRTAAVPAGIASIPGLHSLRLANCKWKKLNGTTLPLGSLSSLTKLDIEVRS